MKYSLLSEKIYVSFRSIEALMLHIGTSPQHIVFCILVSSIQSFVLMMLEDCDSVYEMYIRFSLISQIRGCDSVELCNYVDNLCSNSGNPSTRPINLLTRCSWLDFLCKSDTIQTNGWWFTSLVFCYRMLGYPDALASDLCSV